MSERIIEKDVQTKTVKESLVVEAHHKDNVPEELFCLVYACIVVVFVYSHLFDFINLTKF